MASGDGAGLSDWAEFGALERKIREEKERIALRERALEDQQKEFEQVMKIRKEEFDDLKKHELEKLNAEKWSFQSHQKQQEHVLLWEREKLTKEKASFEECLQRVADITGSDVIITLEVGNEKFRTQIGTLTKWKRSIFPKLMENLQGHREPRIFIDRDSKHFKFILNYMRQGIRVMRGQVSRNLDNYTLEEILAEVEYYKLNDLAQHLQRKIACSGHKIGFEQLLRAKYFQDCNPPSKFTTANEILIKNQNLDGIVFDHVNFRHSMSFDTCTIVRARFVCCTFSSVIRFQNVDMHNVRFENCTPPDVSKHIYFSETDESTITYSPPV